MTFVCQILYPLWMVQVWVGIWNKQKNYWLAKWVKTCQQTQCWHPYKYFLKWLFNCVKLQFFIHCTVGNLLMISWCFWPSALAPPAPWGGKKLVLQFVTGMSHQIFQAILLSQSWGNCSWSALKTDRQSFDFFWHCIHGYADFFW